MDAARDRDGVIRPSGTGLESDRADTVVARLSALTQAARVFGSGVADVDLDIGWSAAGGPEQMVWSTGDGGRRRVEIRLDLERMIAAMEPVRDEGRAAPIESFQSAFLHELGHVLYSGRPPGEPLLDGDRCATLGLGLGQGAQEVAQQPGTRILLNRIGDILEDARIERRLIDRFRGARRYLRAHTEEAVRAAGGDPAGLDLPVAQAGTARELARAVALLYLHIAGDDDAASTAAAPPELEETVARLATSLDAALRAHDADHLADWLVTDLLPELIRSFPTVFEPASDAAGRRPGRPDGAAPDETAPTSAREEGENGPKATRRPSEERRDGERPAAEAPSTRAYRDTATLLEDMAERLRSPGLLGPNVRVDELGGGSGRRERLERRIVVYPHMDGTLVVDEVPVARALTVPPTVQSRQVLEQVTRRYGPPALEAFAAERAALRRAFEVNFEQRFAGRYRTGRRVGVRNLRRMSVSRDLRLFQKLEIPNRLSYYFHLMIDVSPSMLTDRNAAKAIAAGYAFTETLDRLRVPVDVSLYSAAITELYDHQLDRLDLFFGGDFGYYSSGTHEIEAIAYAKQKADAVDQTRKLIVVLTDGHPNSVALQRAGSADLRTYYRNALIPWLKAARIDLLAIGIGHSPAYHEKRVSIGSSWESIGVFMQLLDDVIAEGRRSHAALWM